MNIFSLNVNGIRASVRKGLIKYLETENYDIICFNEVRAGESILPKELTEYSKLNKYEIVWNDSARKGYAGTGILTKIKPLNVFKGIQDPEDLDDKEGRCITLEFDKYFLVNIYTPNSGMADLKFSKRRENWDKFFYLYMEHLTNQKPIVLCGDMNVARFDTDVYDGETNKKRSKTAGFTDYERFNFKVLLTEMKLIDTWKLVNKDAKREEGYTFWTNLGKMKETNRGWRIDYYLISDLLKSKIKDMKTLQSLTYSDHCPIILKINI